jgi:hypothetical protein
MGPPTKSNRHTKMYWKARSGLHQVFILLVNDLLNSLFIHLFIGFRIFSWERITTECVLDPDHEIRSNTCYG